jgi:hypothetical protein
MIVLRRQAFPGQVVAQRWPLDAGNSIGDRENSPAARGRSLATIVQLKFIRELQAANTQPAPVAESSVEHSYKNRESRCPRQV